MYLLEKDLSIYFRDWDNLLHCARIFNNTRMYQYTKDKTGLTIISLKDKKIQFPPLKMSTLSKKCNFKEILSVGPV